MTDQHLASATAYAVTYGMHTEATSHALISIAKSLERIANALEQPRSTDHTTRIEVPL